MSIRVLETHETPIPVPPVDGLIIAARHVGGSYRRGICREAGVTEHGGQFSCSRLRGHTGRHAAYGSEHVCAVWE